LTVAGSDILLICTWMIGDEEMTDQAAPDERRVFKTPEDRIGAAVVDAALAVHRALGPGLLESVYEAVLARELEKRGFGVVRQAPIAIEVLDMTFEEGFRADIVVDGLVILELKSVERTSRAHAKQLHTYLKLAGSRLGFLLNFGAALMRDGIFRIVNGLEEEARWPRQRAAPPPP
jgi:GxxExxY protein